MRWALLFAVLVAAPLQAQPKKDANSDLKWVDIRTLGIEGQGWEGTKDPFARLPDKAKGVVRDPIWSLSRHSTGLAVRFVTDADAVWARWTLTSPNLAMTHMPATGVSGVDLYVRADDGKWRWLSIGQPKAQTTTAKLVGGLPSAKREYLLYLPLYNGVSSVEIGVSPNAQIDKAQPYRPNHEKPIVFYGTSITQGGCASRPGMVHTALLGRWLDRPVINLGFSGNGRMEPEMATLFAELDPAVFVLDCCPNMSGPLVAERAEPFVRILRKTRPSLPIVFVEDRTYSNAFLIKSSRATNDGNRAALKTAYENLQKSGMTNLYYIPGEDLLGADNEGTVDSSHPTDLGFFRQAEAFAKTLREVLK